VKIKYTVDFIHETEHLHPFLEPPYHHYISDYLQYWHSEQYLKVINFLKKFASSEGEAALWAINDFVCGGAREELTPGLFRYHESIGCYFIIKYWHDYDPLQIVMLPDRNQLLMFDGMYVRFDYEYTRFFYEKTCAFYTVDIDQWLYLWDWWQAKKAVGLKIETGEVEMPIVAKPKASLCKPLAKFLLEKEVPGWLNINDSDCQITGKFLRKWGRWLDRKEHLGSPKIAALLALQKKRALRFTEQTELTFLEKLQAANDVQTLEDLAQALQNIPLAPAFQSQLLQDIAEKKALH
jgi:hypothetical protein